MGPRVLQHKCCAQIFATFEHMISCLSNQLNQTNQRFAKYIYINIFAVILELFWCSHVTEGNAASFETTAFAGEDDSSTYSIPFFFFSFLFAIFSHLITHWRVFFFLSSSWCEIFGANSFCTMYYWKCMSYSFIISKTSHAFIHDKNIIYPFIKEYIMYYFTSMYYWKYIIYFPYRRVFDVFLL